MEDRPHPGRPPVLTPEMRTTTDCLRQADCAWNCAQLAERLQQHYGVAVSIETARPFLHRAGFVWQRTRYVPARRPDPQEYADAQDDLQFPKRELCTTCGSDGMWMRRGCGLAPEPTYSWCPLGQPVVPRRAGKPSRVNVIRALGLCGGQWAWQWQLIEGKVDSSVVIGFVEGLRARASRARPVVVWDQAPFHTAQAIGERLAGWAAQGLYVYLLPAYSLQLNLVERCWLELKARLLPHRWYADVEALRAGVVAGLEALQARLEKGFLNIGGTQIFPT